MRDSVLGPVSRMYRIVRRKTVEYMNLISEEAIIEHNRCNKDAQEHP